MAKQSTATAVPVLLTRPDAQSRAFAFALDQRFGDRLLCVLAPLMAPDFLSPSLPNGHFDAVVFTSATAVQAARKLAVPLPARAWCVGDQTKGAARAAGFDAISANGNADDLVAAILSDRPQGRLLHLRGHDSRGNVAERLTSEGIPTIAAVVYRQVPTPLTPEAIRLLQRPTPVILPIFSPRSATLLAAALPANACALLYTAALSDAVTKAATPLPQVASTVALHPDADAMLEAVGTLLAMIPSP